MSVRPCLRRQVPGDARRRVIGTVILILGVGLFGVFTGYVARIFLAPRQEDTETDEDLPGPIDS